MEFDDIIDDAKYKRCIIKLKNNDVNFIKDINDDTITSLVKALHKLPYDELKDIITNILGGYRSCIETADSKGRCNFIKVLTSFRKIIQEIVDES